MYQKKKLILLAITNLLLCFWIITQKVGAAGGTFTVTPQKINNQIGSVNQGWYLHVHPNTDYQIKFQLSNLTNHTNVIEVLPTVAQTTSSLQIGIDNVDAKPGPLAQYDFRQLVTGKQVILKPQQTVTDKIVVHVPAEGIQGILMGGLLFRSQTDVQNQLNNLSRKRTATSTVVSTAAIAYGCFLQQDMRRLDIQLNLGTPKLVLDNQTPSLITPLKNLTAYPFVRGKLKLQVVNKQNPKLNFTQTVDNINIAANSRTHWVIPWQKGPLLAGKYYLTYSFTNPRLHYRFNKTIILTQKDVERFNKYLPKSQPSYWTILFVILIIIAALLVLLTVLVYRFGRHKSLTK